MSKQTGPKTPEGKAKSSQNALKHGLASDRMFVLANENQESWEKILNLWTEKLQPRDDAETMIVEDIAHAQWKIRRARTIETGLIDHEMQLQFDTLAAAWEPPIDEGIRAASAFKGLSDNSRGLDNLHRYEVRARRAFKSGLAALDQLRSLCSSPQPAAVVPDSKPEPAPAPGTNRQNSPAETPKPRLVPPKRPVAQQLATDNKESQNEMAPRHRSRRSSTQNPVLRRVREALGTKSPVRISLLRRINQA